MSKVIVNYPGDPVHYAPATIHDVDAILVGISKDLKKIHTTEAAKSCIRASVLSYFTSKEANNLETFKKLIIGIKNLLSEKYDSKTSSKVFSESFEFIYKWSGDHEFTDQQDFLAQNKGHILECKEQEHKVELGGEHTDCTD